MINLRKREGRMIEYKASDGKWKSTHTKDQAKAVKYVKNLGGSASLTFGEFSKNIFTNKGKGSYYELCHRTKKRQSSEWWYGNQNRYVRYVYPAFRNVPLDMLTAPMIQEWYLTLDKYSTKRLAPATRRKILNALSVILEYAVFLGHIRFNPCKNVMKMPDDCKKREIYSKRELSMMFPDDRERLEYIWGNLRWACYFMVVRDTGFRPGEVAGIDFNGLILRKKGVFTKQSIDSFSKEVKKSVKTTYSGGYDYRPGILSDYTMKWLCIMLNEYDIDSGLVFLNNRGELITTAASRKVIRIACERLGIPYRATYSMRTTFFSKQAQTIPEEALKELMGHKKWRSCYDARTPEEVIDKIISLTDDHVGTEER